MSDKSQVAYGQAGMNSGDNRKMNCQTLGGLKYRNLSPGAKAWESKITILAELGSLWDSSLQSFPASSSLLVVAVNP